MVYKSLSQPLCRCCAKPIAKSTRVVWLRATGSYGSDSTFSRTLNVETFPPNRDECQRLTNWTVTAVSYGPGSDDKPRHITSFHEWDGESWKDDLFCTGTCAQAFGRLAARHTTLRTQSYAAAIEGKS